MDTVITQKSQREFFLENITNRLFSSFFITYAPSPIYEDFDCELAYLLKEYDDCLSQTDRLQFAQLVTQQRALFTKSSTMPAWLISYSELLTKIPQPHDPYRIQQLRGLLTTHDNSLELRFILALSLAQHGLLVHDVHYFTESHALFKNLQRYLDKTVKLENLPTTSTKPGSLFAAAKLLFFQNYASCLLSLNQTEKAIAILENALVHEAEYFEPSHILALKTQLRTLQIAALAAEAFDKKAHALFEKHAIEHNRRESHHNTLLGIFLGTSFLLPILTSLITMSSKLAYDQLVRVIIATGLTSLLIVGFSILLTRIKSKFITILMLLSIVGLLAFIVLGLTPLKSLLLTAAQYAYQSIIG